MERSTIAMARNLSVLNNHTFRAVEGSVTIVVNAARSAGLKARKAAAIPCDLDQSTHAVSRSAVEAQEKGDDKIARPCMERPKNVHLDITLYNAGTGRLQHLFLVQELRAACGMQGLQVHGY